MLPIHNAANAVYTRTDGLPVTEPRGFRAPNAFPNSVTLIVHPRFLDAPK